MTALAAALRAEAVAARAAGDHHGAVRSWRRLLDAAPDDWALGLELKHDLRAGGIYPDSDLRFRRAAAALPDERWVEHYAFFYTFHGAALDGLEARARRLIQATPGDARLQVILADVALHRRDWAGAEAAFAAAARLRPLTQAEAMRAAPVPLYAARSRQAWPEQGPAYEIFLINLDRNTGRLAEFERQFARCLPPIRRQPGIEGARLPWSAVQRLTGSATAPRGTLGCFMTHAAAWEALLASPVDCGLIVEDDTIPLLDLPARLGGLDLPPGWEIVWVNDRMEPQRQDRLDMFAQPLATVLAGFDPEHNAPGADAYLLSRAGARKLLEWVGEDGMGDDVDWRMVAYSLTPADVAAIPEHLVARRLYLDRLAPAIPRAERLSAYALHPALVRSVGVDSDREDGNRVSFAEPG